MDELSKQLVLLDSGSVEIAFLYEGLTKLRKDCVKLVVYSLCNDMKNPESTFERDLQRDLDAARAKALPLGNSTLAAGSHPHIQ